MQHYQLPMHTVAVTLHFADRHSGEFLVFLSTSANGRSETLDGYLNDGRSFLPCQETDGGALRFVLKRHLAVLEVAAGSPHVDGHDGGLPTNRVDVAVRLANGEERRGEVRIFNAPEVSRLSDYLNGPEIFIPVYGRATVAYVSKSMILAVEPIAKAQAAKPTKTKKPASKGGSASRSVPKRGAPPAPPRGKRPAAPPPRGKRPAAPPPRGKRPAAPKRSTARPATAPRRRTR